MEDSHQAGRLKLGTRIFIVLSMNAFNFIIKMTYQYFLLLLFNILFPHYSPPKFPVFSVIPSPSLLTDILILLSSIFIRHHFYPAIKKVTDEDRKCRYGVGGRMGRVRTWVTLRDSD